MKLVHNHGRKKTLIFASIVNLFFVVTLLLHAPVESYIGGASDFWFTFSDLLPAIIVTALGTFVALEILDFLLPVQLTKFLSGLLFAFGFCSYIQVNFLNPDYGLLGAQEIDWSTLSNVAYVYAAIWGVLLVLIPILCIITKGNLLTNAIKAIAGLLTVMQAVSLVALLVSNASLLQTKKDLTLTREEMFTVGEEEGSIAVFILDTMDNLYFQTALEAEPELESVFDGFTIFTNTTGSYSKTWGSVSYILSGIPYLNQTTYDEYCEAAYKDSKLFSTLRENGYDIRVFPSLPEKHIIPYVDNAGERTTIINDLPTLYAHFLKYVGFRTMPEIVKEELYVDAYVFNTLQALVGYNSQYLSDDPFFFSQLKEFGISTENKKTFRFYHLNGAHAPFVMDENGNSVTSASSKQQNIGVIRILQYYFEQMKEKGVYDSTTIMILGDHSRYKNSESVFIVKPENSRGAMKESKAPVCHEDVHNTLFDLANLPEVDYGLPAFKIAENEVRTRKGWLYFAEEMWNYQPNYLPPLWEVTYGFDNMAPNYTGVVYDGGKKLTFADVAKTVTFGTSYGYEDLQNFFPVDSLIWGDEKEGYKFLNMRQGKLFFRVPSVPDQGINVSMSFIKWMPLSENRLSISCCGQIVFDKTFYGSMDSQISFLIPAECIDRVTGLVTLDIFTPNAQMISDHRLITFGLKEITVY